MPSCQSCRAVSSASIFQCYLAAPQVPAQPGFSGTVFGIEEERDERAASGVGGPGDCGDGPARGRRSPLLSGIRGAARWAAGPGRRRARRCLRAHASRSDPDVSREPGDHGDLPRRLRPRSRPPPPPIRTARRSPGCASPRPGSTASSSAATTSATLEKGPGHVPGSELPGEETSRRNCVITAHRDSHFRHLGWLRKGQRIELETPSGNTSYRVVSREIVKPDAVQVLQPTAEPRLTLITCYPFNWIGPAPQRLVVVAEPLLSRTPPVKTAGRRRRLASC